MTAYQTVNYEIDAVQWVSGTTTIAQVRQVHSGAFIADDGGLYVPRKVNPFANLKVPNTYWVYILDGEVVIEAPHVFANKYELA